MKVTDINPSKKFSSPLESTGFQATELSRASHVLKRMLEDKDCTRFLSFTSNMMATGLRGIFTDMALTKKFDVVVTAGGSIDHDFIRCFADYEIGGFNEDDVQLHKDGINRLGNVLIDNKHYVMFEEKMQALFKEMAKKKNVWSPSEVTLELGKKFKGNKSSFLAACAKNNIPVYCPGIVDSALGLQLYYFKQDHPDFIVDVAGDMRQLATTVLSAKRTGGLVLGGGISKHYTIASNLIRGGLDYSVYVTTSAAFDGSLSGAPPREAQSWGKVKEKATTATVNGDATLVLPLLYSMV